MKNTNRIRQIAMPALLTLALLGTFSAWSQTPAAGAPGGATSAAPGKASRAQKHEDFVEKRIGEMRTQLKITDQQSQQWDTFAQTMRDNAEKAGQAFQDRAQKLSSMNADDAMKSYAAVSQVHADNMQKLAAAFSPLYAVLSDDQKKIADKLFRNEHAGRRHQSPHKHLPAAPAN